MKAVNTLTSNSQIFIFKNFLELIDREREESIKSIQTKVVCRRSNLKWAHQHDGSKFNDKRRVHFSAVTPKSVKVPPMIFQASSKAVRNVRKDFPTKYRQLISEA
jgi:hypothetical protein